jgi:hypothetical protein
VWKDESAGGLPSQLGRGLTNQPLRIGADQRRAKYDPNPEPAAAPVAGEGPADHEGASSTAAANIGVQPEELEGPFINSPVNPVEIPGVAPGTPPDPASSAGRAQFGRRQRCFRTPRGFRRDHIQASLTHLLAYYRLNCRRSSYPWVRISSLWRLTCGINLHKTRPRNKGDQV